MTTGIYLLDFGKDTYVGKSTNIESRVQQHIGALQTDTAARPLQNAYLNKGIPKFKILETCHSDHLDILETFYVYKLMPSLNTAKTAPLSTEDYEFLLDDTYRNVLKYSTTEILEELKQADELEEFLHNRIKELQVLFDEEAMKLEIGRQLDKTKKELEEYTAISTEFFRKITEYIHAPWYKRIFMKRPV